MDLERSVGFWIVTFLMVTIVLFFGIFRLGQMFFGEFIFQSCLLSVIGGFVLIYIMLMVSESISHGEKEGEPFGSSSETREKKDKVSSEEVTKEKVHVGKESGKEKSSLLDKIKGKKTCENCGSELEYKESFDSYYCPECHEYK